MKTHFLKSTVVLILICTLVFSLTGCDSLDYRDAIDLYNAGSFKEAAAMFALLEDYEDSARMETRCHYWMALEDMEAGNYESALQQFEALGDYEDAPARITECTYQMALAAFDSGELDLAEQYFQKTAAYRQTAEYIRRINWQRLHAAIAETGTEGVLLQDDGSMVISVCAKRADPDTLLFAISQTKDMGYVFYDALQITLTRDSLQAVFDAESTFTMDFNGSEIGSTQTCRGSLDIPTFTGETVLTPETFQISVSDNLGKTWSSSDPADSLMADAMAENEELLMDAVPDMLSDADITLTLADIGFAAIQ